MKPIEYNTHEARYHDRYGDWTINGKTYRFKLNNYRHLLTPDKLKTVSFDDIAFKGRHLTNLRGPMCLCCDGSRYYNAKIKQPGILVENMENPYNLKYRMIDGKHRIEKMINLGMTHSEFHVLQVSDLM
tara:strand:+ start:796 stop:1182 length:387 start_codon:yes stop_codon:yes gene_type:complete